MEPSVIGWLFFIIFAFKELLFRICCIINQETAIKLMKSNLILLAIAFFALMTSCKEADYQKEVETRLEAFDTFYKDLKDNAEMSMDEKEDAFEAEYEILLVSAESRKFKKNCPRFIANNGRHT